MITIRNRPRSLDLVLELLETHGIDEIEIVDNATSDPTLTNRLNSLSMPVRRLPTDLGAAAAWVSGAMAQRLLASDVLLIDASRPGATIPADTCPADVMARMSHELLRQPAVDAVELSPSSDEDRGRFRLVRIGLDRIPVTIAFLDPPYMSVTVVPDPTDPSERFARLHDELQLDVPPPL